MQTPVSSPNPGTAGAPANAAPGEEALPPSVAIRCGASETAAIIRLLEQLPAACQAIEAWDGVSRDQHQRVRQKYARLLADLFQRHPEQVLAGLGSPQAHTRIWIALAISEAPDAAAVPALEVALMAEDDELCCQALMQAMRVCKGCAAPPG
ncbi:MAG: putative rane protein [Betaproteobacteria bacterium]|nr:putative rane protein [Betaproteobacteria bacterium]